MAIPVVLSEAVRWIVITFGKDIFVALTDTVQHQWRRVFAARNILILGPKQTGKSSLVQYVKSGRPFEIVEGEVRAPAPTALGAVVDQRFALQKGNWLRLRTDVPGDLDLRDTWAQAIADIKPHGIIYMVDGRRDDAALQEDVRDIERSVLEHYASGLGNLLALHVFVSFMDAWAQTAVEQRRRTRVVHDALDELTARSALWCALRIGVSATQLSPNRSSWEDVDRALHHFGADLAR